MELINKVVRKGILELKDEIIKIRRDLHQHPELAFEEHRTSSFVLNFLKKLGIDAKIVAKTGVIATLKGELIGEKVVALRADMDALSIVEENDISYKSKNEGVMHACGHDGHTSILLGTAKYLSKNKNLFGGTVRFIFQPAEENIGGAVPLIKEGCLENPSVDAIFGLHIWPKMEVGKFGVNEGAIMASTSELEVEIIGKGGHGAMPHEAVDSIVVASQFVTGVQTLISRDINPLETGVVTFGTIQGGTNGNVIAPSVKLKGTMRAMSEENMALLKERIEELLAGICKAFKANYKLHFIEGYPALVNDKELVDFSKKVITDLLDSNAPVKRQTMGAEDFSYYAQKVPGCYVFLGAANPETPVDKRIPLHHPHFNFDENALLLGIEYFVTATCSYLKK